MSKYAELERNLQVNCGVHYHHYSSPHKHEGEPLINIVIFIFGWSMSTQRSVKKFSHLYEKILDTAKDRPNKIYHIVQTTNDSIFRLKYPRPTVDKRLRMVLHALQ
eukprot:PhF_6_TR38698/c0_g1_i2/m.57905